MSEGGPGGHCETPAETGRGGGGAREGDLTWLVRWESIPSVPPPPPVLPSRRLSLLIVWPPSLPIRPIALCRRHARHLSYHCPDNSLLVRKSLLRGPSVPMTMTR